MNRYPCPVRVSMKQGSSDDLQRIPDIEELIVRDCWFYYVVVSTINLRMLQCSSLIRTELGDIYSDVLGLRTGMLINSGGTGISQYRSCSAAEVAVKSFQSTQRPISSG